MKTFNYKVDLYLKVWQEISLSVNAPTKEEANSMIIQLAKEQPLSLDNGNENIEMTSTEYLCETESLVDNSDSHTVQVYEEDCKCCAPEFAIYTNIKKTEEPSIKNEFKRITAIREEYTQKTRDILFKYLEQKKKPVILAREKEDEDEGRDVIVAYSDHSNANNGRILSVWIENKTICMEIQDSQNGETLNIDESDLEDDGLYFIMERILSEK